MKKTNPFLVLILALGILSGCAAGQAFNHQRAAELDLHKVKKSEYAAIFGQPFRTAGLYAGGSKYRILRYYYGYHFIGSLSVRNLFLEFKNEELNAYLYGSSFRDDKTDVDISKAENITIGVSTRDDAVSLFGKPYGKAFCPSQLGDFKENCAKAKEVWEWYMFQYGSGNKIVEKKYLIVLFGEDGKVLDFKAADEKE